MIHTKIRLNKAFSFGGNGLLEGIFNFALKQSYLDPVKIILLVKIKTSWLQISSKVDRGHVTNYKKSRSVL